MDWIKDAEACPVLKGVPLTDLHDLFSDVKFQVVHLKKDEQLAVQGDEVRYFMVLLRGSVRGEMTDYSGKLIRIEDIRAPKPIAGAFLFGKNNKYPVDVLANENSSILKIRKDEFLKLLQRNPLIQLNYLNLVSTKAQFLSNKIRFLSLKNLKSKMAHYLLTLPADENGIIRIPETQQSLAGLFGVARPSVARIIKQMEEEGILEVTNREVTIKRPEVLAEFIKE